MNTLLGMHHFAACDSFSVHATHLISTAAVHPTNTKLQLAWSHSCAKSICTTTDTWIVLHWYVDILLKNFICTTQVWDAPRSGQRIEVLWFLEQRVYVQCGATDNMFCYTYAIHWRFAVAAHPKLWHRLLTCIDHLSHQSRIKHCASEGERESVLYTWLFWAKELIEPPRGRCFS